MIISFLKKQLDYLSCAKNSVSYKHLGGSQLYSVHAATWVDEEEVAMSSSNQYLSEYMMRLNPYIFIRIKGTLFSYSIFILPRSPLMLYV